MFWVALDDTTVQNGCLYFMMHSSAPNRSDRYRISIDTRYQLACEEKDDRFFFREDGSWLGNFYNKGASYRPIEELRREWRLD